MQSRSQVTLPTLAKHSEPPTRGSQLRSGSKNSGQGRSIKTSFAEFDVSKMAPSRGAKTVTNKKQNKILQNALAEINKNTDLAVEIKDPSLLRASQASGQAPN